MRNRGSCNFPPFKAEHNQWYSKSLCLASITALLQAKLMLLTFPHSSNYTL